MTPPSPNDPCRTTNSLSAPADPTHDQAAPASAQPDSPAPALGRFQVVSAIGQGGMGCVFRGRDPELDRDLALKVLLPGHVGKPHLEQRFLEEARIAGRLEHPGVPAVHELGRAEDGRPFFAMKLIRGQTLAELLAARSDPSAELPYFLGIFEQICQTIAYAHAHGVIHRDLKPANVMVGKFGEVQVMDWGLAKILGESHCSDTAAAQSVFQSSGAGLTRDGSVLGTPAYMAPEAARGQVDKLDERADVFGLGAILCVILTGAPPFSRGESSALIRRAARGEVGDALARLDSCAADAELIALAKDCLEAEAADRPRDAAAVAARVTSYRAGVEVRLRQAELAGAEARARAAEERKRRRLTLALTLALLALVGLGGGGYAWVQHQRGERQATLARALDAALQRAAEMRGKAAAAPVGDLAAWGEALAEIGRAEDLLAQGEADAAQQARVKAMGDEVKQGRDEAQRQADAATAERQLVARLETVRAEHGEHWDARKADRAFGEAFRAFGLDLDALDPKTAGAQLANRPATAEIAAALDEWCTLRRIDLAGRPDAPPWQPLAQAARTADPDPWRDSLRAHFNQPLAKTSAALREQADDAAGLARQPVASLVLLAGMLRRAGERDRAVTVLRSAWQRFPGDFWVNYKLGHSSWSSSRYQRPDEAVRFLTAAVAARPGSSAAHNNLGNALRAKKDVVGAMACYRKAIELDPHCAPAHSNLGNALRDQKNVDGAIACFQKALEIDPNYALAHNNLGNALRDKNDVDRAIACFQKAIALDEKLALAHSNLGNAWLRKNNEPEAVACFQKAIELDANLAPAHVGLGNVMLIKRDVARALPCFRKAIDLDPNDARAHNGLGLALRGKKNEDEAIACFRQAIALESELAQAHMNLGNALQDRKELDEAIACYKTALGIDPELALAHYNLGVAWYSKKEVDAAIACYRQAIFLRPRLIDAHISLGNALARKHNEEEAIASYQKARDLSPRHVQVHYNLGLALRARGRFDEALVSLRRGLEVAPRADWIHGALQQRIAETERLVPLAGQLPIFLSGAAQPANANVALGLVQICQYTHRHAASARFCAVAFLAQPDLADDLKAGHRYNAACYAALAAAGQGADAAKLDEQQRAQLRRQAFAWLRADLTLYAKQAGSDQAAVQAQMRHWQQDGDFATVREPALDRLPADERAAWRGLWADVAALLRKTER
jgi:serine/threonine-protein kinase